MLSLRELTIQARQAVLRQGKATHANHDKATNRNPSRLRKENSQCCSQPAHVHVVRPNPRSLNVNPFQYQQSSAVARMHELLMITSAGVSYSQTSYRETLLQNFHMVNATVTCVGKDSLVTLPRLTPDGSRVAMSLHRHQAVTRLLPIARLASYLIGR